MKRNNLLKRPLFLTTEIALAALLVACGGGGGDGSASVADSQAADSQVAAAPAAEAPAADAASGEAAAADPAAASTGEDEVASAANAAPEGDGVEVEGGGDVATRAQEANAAQEAAAASAGGDQVASNEEIDYRSPGDSVEESFAEPPADQPEVAAAAVEREEAQAVSGYATPRVAGLDYSGDFSSTRKALLAKHKFAVIGLSQSYGATTLNRVVNDIKALNPSIKIGRYVINSEVRCTASSTHDKYPIVKAVNTCELVVAHGRRFEGAVDRRFRSLRPQHHVVVAQEFGRPDLHPVEVGIRLELVLQASSQGRLRVHRRIHVEAARHVPTGTAMAPTTRATTRPSRRQCAAVMRPTSTPRERRIRR